MHKIFNQKIIVLFYMALLFIILIILRLGYLQIHLTNKLFDLSTRNFTKIVKILSPRGNIVDSTGHLLVTNRPVRNIYWYGTGNKELTQDQIKTIKLLEKIINKEILKSEKEFLKIKNTEKYSKLLPISNDISFEQLSKILEQLNSCSNIKIETKFQRFYPHKTMASHILGYLTQIEPDTTGKMGLEKIFEETLKGEPGTLITTINSVGKSLCSKEIKPVVSGKTLKTTIDFHIQKLAEELFPEMFKGALIIMDPKNGAIKALLSRPNFNPEIFLGHLSPEEWNEIKDKKPFINRAFNACYPPASIFKLVTITAALDLGIIRQDSQWYCNGFVNFCDRKYHCNRLSGHGPIKTKEAIIQSCNIPFFEIAKRLSIDDLFKYAKEFGFGQKTGILFHEQEGLIPSSEWKIKNLGERWWPGETLSASIGQSFFSVTPIQIIRFISAIFEGYLVRPRILEDEPIEKIMLNIRKDALEFLQQSMKKVAESGTAQRVGKIKNINVYAKTGTAQTSSLEKRNLSEKFLEHAWFVSNFSYKDKEPLTMVIVLENAGSTHIAINIAKAFFIQYRTLMNEIYK